MATTRTRQSAAARAAAATVTYDEGLRRFLSNVLLTMGFGVAITGAVTFVVVNTDLLHLFITKGEKGPTLSWTWWFFAIVEFILVMFMASWVKEGDATFKTAMTVFAIYAGFNGLTLSPAISLYTGASVTKVFLISACVFGACALYGQVTKHDLTRWSGTFMMLLIGLIVAMVINLFLRSSALDFTLSVFGVLLFMGLTAWDMQMLRKMYDEYGNNAGLVVNGALALYLDFINLFLMILRLFGVKTSD